ncbi:MAG: glycoside hydrolase family 127 protein [bacterium]|jgi:DUF1680 family protein|nr:glycoside hydrolase family 127 protein [bacterium]
MHRKINWLLLSFVFLSSAMADPLPVSFPPKAEALGETQIRLEKAFNRVCSEPLSDPEFVLSDLHFRYTRRFTEYSGDISGRLFGALNAAEPILNTSALIMPSLLEGFKHTQKPDGHFGVEQDLAKQIDQTKDMPILWGNGRLLLALVEYTRDHANAETLAQAKKLGDYLISTRPYYGKPENFEKVGGVFASGFTTCYPSLIDGLTALTQLTGEQKYIDEARYIAGLALLDKEFDHHHSHGRLTQYRGMLDIDRLCGTTDYLEAVVQGCDTIKQRYQMPTGGVTESFDLDYPRDEGCTEGDWVRVNFFLWLATGNPAYLDDTEHILRNHLYATHLANGGFGHTVFNPLYQGETPFYAAGMTNHSVDSFWCCSMHCTQVLADTARWGVVQSESNFYITWLSETRATFDHGSNPLTITLLKKGATSWTVELDAAKESSCTIHLRVPAWANQIHIDGEQFNPTNGWVALPLTWSNTKKFNIYLPNRIRLAGAYHLPRKENEPVRLFDGPDLYALPLHLMDPSIRSATVVPQILFAADRAENETIPVLLRSEGAKMQKASLVPLANRPQGGCIYLFNARRISEEEFENHSKFAQEPPQIGSLLQVKVGGDGPKPVYLDGELLYTQQSETECPNVPAHSTRDTHVLSILVPAAIARKGVICTIQTPQGEIHSSIDNWTAVALPTEPDPAWLTDIQLGQEAALRLIDKGTYGNYPWLHMPGHFAEKKARWIWPMEVDPQAKYILFRTEFK